MDATTMLLHIREYIRCAQGLQKPYAIMIADMQNAFDKINTNFLRATLRQFNFPTKFLNVITLLQRIPKCHNIIAKN